MRTITPWTLAAVLCVMPAVSAPKPKPKPKPPTAAQLQVQLKNATEERDELKERLTAMENIEQELAAAQNGKELARQESEGLRKELTALRASLSENQSGSDAILQELQKAKADLAACQVDRSVLEKELEEAKARTKVVDPMVETITAARPLNLNRVTPKVRGVDTGVVVVNALIGDNGEVLDTRLVQGLPGSSPEVKKANEACVEAAKRIVFDPARSADGKTKLRVWQAVGFLVD